MRYPFMLFVLATSASALAAPPAPRDERPPPIDSRPVDPIMLGYRISVHPMVRTHVCRPRERCSSGVVTESVTWQIRTIFESPDRVLVEGPFFDPGRGRVIADRTVKTNRWWEPHDVPSETRIVADPVLAHRAFLDWSSSDDPMRLDPYLGRESERPPPPPHPPHRGTAMCEKTLLDRGGHPSLLKHCEGVDDRCAVALLTRGHTAHSLSYCRDPEPTCAVLLLERGHNPVQLTECKRDLQPLCVAALLERGFHPSLLSRCRAVEDRCAVALLGKGHHPSHLERCAPDLSPACTEALLAANHHPMHLQNCRGVDDRCALAVLERGHHPSQLSSCKR